MSGILEMMKVQLDQASQDIAALKATVASMTNGGGAVHTPPAVDPFAAFGVPKKEAPTTITEEVIMELISPHLDNEAIRKGLGVEMRAMGIENLPDTPEDKYPELHARFVACIARFQQGTPANDGVQAAPPKTAGII